MSFHEIFLLVEFGLSYVEITNDGAFAQFQGSHNLQIRPNFKDSRLAEMMTYENSLGYLGKPHGTISAVQMDFCHEGGGG